MSLDTKLPTVAHQVSLGTKLRKLQRLVAARKRKRRRQDYKR